MLSNNASISEPLTVKRGVILESPFFVWIILYGEYIFAEYSSFENAEHIWTQAEMQKLLSEPSYFRGGEKFN
jgi:hypothetical protein